MSLCLFHCAANKYIFRHLEFNNEIKLLLFKIVGALNDEGTVNHG